VDRGDRAGVERGVKLAPFARRHHRPGGQPHRRQHLADHHRVGGEHLAQKRDRRPVAAAAIRRRDRAGGDLARGIGQHRAGQHVLGLGMGRDAEARHVDPDDPHPVDLVGQKPERHARGGRHAQVRHHDRVVAIGIGQVMDRGADILEQLAGHQRFGIERHVADRAPRAVEMRHEGQPVDAAGRAGQHRRHPFHPKAHAQAAEGRAHALRLVVRALRVILREAVQQLRLAGLARRRLHLAGRVAPGRGGRLGRRRRGPGGRGIGRDHLHLRGPVVSDFLAHGIIGPFTRRRR